MPETMTDTALPALGCHVRVQGRTHGGKVGKVMKYTQLNVNVLLEGGSAIQVAKTNIQDLNP